MNQTTTAAPAFERITETTGIPLSPEGADMMYTRYFVAANQSAHLRVLELGCGAGQGLGLLARQASSVVGGDLSWPLLQTASQHYRTRIPLVRLSAEELPFADGSFDVIFFFEATYYVPSMQTAFREIARVLSPNGTLMIVNANPERPDFIRSPHSVHYHSADEFRRSLGELGFDVSVEGAFPTTLDNGRKSFVIETLVPATRKALERLGLVPRTLRGRALLKRLVYGKALVAVPNELEPGFANQMPRDPVMPGPARNHKVIYVTATRDPSRAMLSR